MSMKAPSEATGELAGSVSGRRLSMREQAIALDVSRKRGRRKGDNFQVDVSALDHMTHVGLNDRTWFCALVAIEVVANMVAIGLDTDYMCRHNCKKEEFAPWLAVDKIFAALGIIDVVAVVIHLRPKTYFRGVGFRARKFSLEVFRTVDFFVVLIRAIDSFFVTGPGHSSGVKYISLIRVMHIARFANKVQLVGAFRELWLILAGMADTMRTVVWVLVLLLGVMWLFAILLTIAVNDGNRVYDYSMADWTREDYWGNVPRSLFTLCHVLTRDNWSDNLSWPLVEVNMPMVFIFVAFFAIAVLAILNTIIGVVVESTLRSARNNEDKAARERQKIDQKIMSNLKQIFMDADTDGNGTIEKQELHAALKVPRVRKAIQLLGLPGGDLDLLFNLLDEDGSGKIQTDQFFRGCTRLRGPAMARDLQHMSVDLVRHLASASDHIHMLRGVNDAIAGVLDTLDTIEVDVMHDDADARDPVLMARRTRERASRAQFIRKVNTSRDSSAEARSSASGDEEGPIRLAARMSDLQTTQTNLPTPKPNRFAQLGDRVPPPPPLPPNLDQFPALENESQNQVFKLRFGDKNSLPEDEPFETVDGHARKFGHRPPGAKMASLMSAHPSIKSLADG